MCKHCGVPPYYAFWLGSLYACTCTSLCVSKQRGFARKHLHRRGRLWYTKSKESERSGFMNEYEVLIETINPCGGEAHAKKEFQEIETESPERWVKENGRYPVLDSGKNLSGDTVITTGDGKGILIRYTFTE